MVSILNPHPSPEVAKTTCCKNCGATLSYVPNDVFIEKYAYDYLGDYETRNAINCPNCGKTTGVR